MFNSEIYDDIKLFKSVYIRIKEEIRDSKLKKILETKLSQHLPDVIIILIQNKVIDGNPKRIIIHKELSRHLPDVIIKIIQSYLLPCKANRYVLLQELLNKYFNTCDKQYCLKCNSTTCVHLITVFAQNYNVIRIMSGISGLYYAT